MTDEEYKLALARVDYLWDRLDDEDNAKELDKLADQIVAYEELHFFSTKDMDK